MQPFFNSKYVLQSLKSMTSEPIEMQKAAAGFLYDANYDPILAEQRHNTKVALFELNHLHPDKKAERIAILESLLSKTGNSLIIESPFYCDYGYNIEIGDSFFSNVNLIILDGAKVSIGNNVFIAPNVGLYTTGHPLDVKRRNQGLEYSFPITIGNNVWIGAGAMVLPNVTIGDGCVIGAGSVVTKSIPANMLAVGNPCQIVREITEEDVKKYREQ